MSKAQELQAIPKEEKQMGIWNLFKKRYKGQDIELVEDYTIDGCQENGFVFSVIYKIKLKNKKRVVGHCDLRVGMNEELYYAGNIGYHIKKSYRGNNYAYQATKLLFEIAKKEYRMKELLITCTPTNEASKRICEKLEGHLEEVVDVPSHHWLYQLGEYKKCIYKYQLWGIDNEKNH